MSIPSAEVLIGVAVLILAAVAAGTFTARLFIAASRTPAAPARSDEKP
jgi:hypothetical protein